MESTNKIIPLEVIEPGTKVTIEVTDELYTRIQNIIFHYLPFKDLDHFKQVVAQINSGKYEDKLCETLHTLLWLTNQFEDAAKSQGKLVKKNWDTEKKEIIT